MNVDRHGKAKILSQAEIQLLFRQGFQTSRDRALFGSVLVKQVRSSRQRLHSTSSKVLALKLGHIKSIPDVRFSMLGLFLFVVIFAQTLPNLIRTRQS